MRGHSTVDGFYNTKLHRKSCGDKKKPPVNRVEGRRRERRGKVKGYRNSPLIQSIKSPKTSQRVKRNRYFSLTLLNWIWSDISVNIFFSLFLILFPLFVHDLLNGLWKVTHPVHRRPLPTPTGSNRPAQCLERKRSPPPWSSSSSIITSMAVSRKRSEE